MINFINQTKKTKTKTSTKNQTGICQIRIDYLANWWINSTPRKKMHSSPTKTHTRPQYLEKPHKPKAIAWNKPSPKTRQL